MSICSTLTGKLSVKHPFLNILCREDGAALTRATGGGIVYRYTFGFPRAKGYLRVYINKSQYQIHRLIAEAFIPNPLNKPTVDHINRVRNDNRVCNLRWATYKEQNENRDIH